MQKNGDKIPANNVVYMSQGKVETYKECKVPGHAIVMYKIDTSEG